MRKSLAGIVFGISVGVMPMVSAPLASADPIGPNAVAEFGIMFEDEGHNGQCGAGTSTNPQWVPEGNWTVPIAIDTDNRPLGCKLWFGLNNVDGSLTGLNLAYWWAPATGQCLNPRNNASIPFLPFPGSFPAFFMTPIIVNTDGRQGGCELNFMITGRDDIALDVLWEYNGESDQCPGAELQGAGNPPSTVKAGKGLTLFFDTDNRGGACFLSFSLRHL